MRLEEDEARLFFISNKMLVSLWTDKEGRGPVSSFIKEQTVYDQNRIIKALDKLQTYDMNLLMNSNLLKKLKGYDLYELRIKTRFTFVRILMIIKVNRYNSEALLLHAFNKKSNNTDIKDINIALSRYKRIAI